MCIYLFVFNSNSLYILHLRHVFNWANMCTLLSFSSFSLFPQGQLHLRPAWDPEESEGTGGAGQPDWWCVPLVKHTLLSSVLSFFLPVPSLCFYLSLSLTNSYPQPSSTAVSAPISAPVVWPLVESARCSGQESKRHWSISLSHYFLLGDRNQNSMPISQRQEALSSPPTWGLYLLSLH